MRGEMAIPEDDLFESLMVNSIYKELTHSHENLSYFATKAEECMAYSIEYNVDPQVAAVALGWETEEDIEENKMAQACIKSVRLALDYYFPGGII